MSCWRLVLSGLVSASLLLACGGSPSKTAVEAAAANPSPSLSPVGLADLTYEDSARQRPLRTLIWYPAEAQTVAADSALEGIFESHAVKDARIAPSPAPRPLIVLSHGTGGGASNLGWLAEALARQGYVVAAVDHFGNTFRNNSPDGARALWRRPPDIRRMIDALLKDPTWGARIAPSRIGAAGFSAGGYTVIALAGGILHPARLGEHCRKHPDDGGCKLVAGAPPIDLADVAHASDSFEDPRIRGVFAMAPAVGLGFDASDLAGVHVPVSIVAGVHDEVVPFAENAQRFGTLIAGAELHPLPAGGHFLFMPLCNALGLQHAHEICSDSDPSVDRRKVHEQVQGWAVEFFGRVLKGG